MEVFPSLYAFIDSSFGIETKVKLNCSEKQLQFELEYVSKAIATCLIKLLSSASGIEVA